MQQLLYDILYTSYTLYTYISLYHIYIICSIYTLYPSNRHAFFQFSSWSSGSPGVGSRPSTAAQRQSSITGTPWPSSSRLKCSRSSRGPLCSNLHATAHVNEKD